MSEVEKFDPSKLMDGVKDRIKATFISLIPDDQWEIMVKKEIDKFFELRDTNNYSNSQDRWKSDFGNLVRNEVHEYCKNKLAEYLKQPEFNESWKGNEARVSEYIKKFMIENSGELMMNMFGGLFQSAISSLKSQMIDNTYR